MGCLFLLALDSGRRSSEVKYICFDKKSVTDNQVDYIPVWYSRVHSSHVIAWRILTNFTQKPLFKNISFKLEK